MSRRNAARVALLSLVALAIGAGAVGGTHAYFSGQTASSANLVAASTDFRGPTFSSVAIGKSAGGAIGFIGSSRNYRIYANVTDALGTPPSGVSTVRADVSALTTGQTSVALTAGSWTVNGQTFNYRSATRTASAGRPAGPLAFTVTATDAAGNATVANGSVVVENTAPSATDIQATGGIAGRPEVGDVLTLTFSEPIEPNSILANWTGAALPVELRIRENAGSDRVEVWDVGQNTRANLGTISLGRPDFTTTNIWFSGSTMTRSGSTITVVLGGPVTGTVTTVAGTGTMSWTPTTAALDPAGNPMSTTTRNETGAADLDF